MGNQDTIEVIPILHEDDSGWNDILRLGLTSRMSTVECDCLLERNATNSDLDAPSEFSSSKQGEFQVGSADLQGEFG
jgi:hypothetical protein